MESTDTKTVNAIIEIPKGSNNKYEYNKDTGQFYLDRVLYSPVHYPADYGYIPETLAKDGDPLDILVIVTNPTFPGCLIQVKPIGALEMSDIKGPDVKILGVPVADPRLSQISDLDDIPHHVLKEIEYFFSIYKELEGENVITSGWRDTAYAWKEINQATDTYRLRKNQVGGDG